MSLSEATSIKLLNSGRLARSTVMPEPRRYYFRIPSAKVFEFVIASSLTEAKLIAADHWLTFWDELEWINVETVTESVIYD